MLSALFGLRYPPRHVDSGKLCVSHSVIPVSWLFICLALCSLSRRLPLLPRSLFHLRILPLSCSFPLSPSYSLVSLFYFALGRFLSPCHLRCFSFTRLPLCFAPYLPLTLKTQSLFILLLFPHLSLFVLLFVFPICLSVAFFELLLFSSLPSSPVSWLFHFFTRSHPFLSSSWFSFLFSAFLPCSFFPPALFSYCNFSSPNLLLYLLQITLRLTFPSYVLPLLFSFCSPSAQLRATFLSFSHSLLLYFI